MIAFLEGTLQRKGLAELVVNVGGVGYLVHVSSQTLAELPGEGAPVRLNCHTHVREDALQVFGFLHRAEQRAFEHLILVSGIGPKLALTMLSGLPVDQLTAAISGGDHKRLQAIPGVGRKTAERVVLELKERFAKLFGEGAAPAAAAKAGPGLQSGDVVDALVNLGYRRPAAEKAVKRATKKLPKGGGPEELLRLSLKVITEASHG